MVWGAAFEAGQDNLLNSDTKRLVLSSHYYQSAVHHSCTYSIFKVFHSHLKSFVHFSNQYLSLLAGLRLSSCFRLVLPGNLAWEFIPQPPLCLLLPWSDSLLSASVSHAYKYTPTRTETHQQTSIHQQNQLTSSCIAVDSVCTRRVHYVCVLCVYQWYTGQFRNNLRSPNTSSNPTENHTAQIAEQPMTRCVSRSFLRLYMIVFSFKNTFM